MFKEGVSRSILLIATNISPTFVNTKINGCVENFNKSSTTLETHVGIVFWLRSSRDPPVFPYQ